MQTGNIPPRIAVPWASGGGKNVILTSSQIGANPGAASWTDGFPPATRTPLVAGGKAPDGLDMNGVLFSVSQWAQWLAAGHPTAYNADFATAIGGYPYLARIIGPDGNIWISRIDNNLADPSNYVINNIPDNERTWARIAYFSDIAGHVGSLNLNSLYVKQGGIPGFTNNDLRLAWDVPSQQLAVSVDNGAYVNRLVDSRTLSNFGINTFFVGGPASGNFTVPANVYRIMVQLVGGGGGGGGSDWINPPSGLVHVTGGGGGAGGYVEFGLSTTPGTVFSYVAGGPGGGGAASANGSAGGTTVFSFLANANGGVGGGSGINSGEGGQGGGTLVLNTAPHTYFFTQGGSGANGALYSSSSLTDGNVPPGGHGGASFFGGGGAGAAGLHPVGTSGAWGSGGGGNLQWDPFPGHPGSAGAIIIRY